MQIKPMMVSEEARAASAFHIQFQIQFDKGSEPRWRTSRGTALFNRHTHVAQGPKQGSMASRAEMQTTWGRSLDPSPFGRQGLLSF